MINQEIAKILQEISDYLKTEEVDFKPFAYEKASLTLESLNEDIKEIYQKGGLKALESISGIGKSIAEKIKEYIETGKIEYYEELKKSLPVNLKEISSVEGMGPKKTRKLYEELGVKNLKELEKAAKENKIAPLLGFGEKTEKNILQGIEFLKRDRGRFLLGEIIPIVKEISQELKKLKEVKKVSPAGSVRRMKETIGDVDILVVSESPRKTTDFFVNLPEVEKVWGKGETKSSVRMKNGLDVDIRIVHERSYGSALQYFTGSKEHNIALRVIAINKGLKLNEYGLFKGSKKIAGKKEKDIYSNLNMDWIPPEMRENKGEIELALQENLPQLVEYDSIKGDLHCHSDWTGGRESIRELATIAQKMGYEYLGITDHTKYLRIENGLTEEQLLKQKKEIKKINSELDIKVLQGCEANILEDGSLDIAEEVLSQLDYVIAGVHSHMKMGSEEMTERIIKAIENPQVDIISHLTGRLIKGRDEYKIDFDKILKFSKKNGIILEINASPVRLDLKDKNIKKAKNAGVKMVINTDSHHKGQLNFMEFGIAQARRGWAEKKDIINTQSLNEILQYFKK